MELPRYFANERGSYTRINEDDVEEMVPSSKSAFSFYAASAIIFAFSLLLLVVLAFDSKQDPILKQAIISKTTTFNEATHPDPPTSLWGSVSRPYPTGAFWTNLVIKNGDGPIGLYPYGIKTIEEGIQVSYGAFRRQVTAASITDYFTVDWQISAVQSYVSRGVESYDNMSVTMSYKTSNNGKYSTYLVKSSPFVTVYFENTTPVLSSPFMKITAVDAKVMKDSTGTQYLVTLGNYQKWLVYCSESVILNWLDNTLTAATPIRGIIRIAILPVINSETTFTALLTYVSRYPIGTNVTFTYPSNTQAVMTIHYTTLGTGPLLMLALPHHIPLLPATQLDTSETKHLQQLYDSIWCMKGKMHVVLGESWKLTYTLPTNLNWYYPITDKIPTTQLDDMANYLLAEVKTIVPYATDPYGFGKQFQRMALLALIADNLGIADARQQAIYNLETTIIPWIQQMNEDVLVYDRTYGGLVSTASIADANSHFGAGWYSDHHFQYGYFLHGIAVLIKLDLPFYESNKAALDTFLRDILNTDSTDLDFPFVRHKDLFDGHSWASGLFQQANGKGQESSSESVNAYYGGYLYALGIGNTELQKVALLLTMMEIHSTQFYWHMSTPATPRDMIYDPLFAASKMIGNIGALDVTTSTWFGNAIEYVHGINVMPLSPVTGFLFDSNFVQQQAPLLLDRLQAISPTSYSSICSANPACNAAHLDGQCCPTNDGIMLGCCDSMQSSNQFHDEWRSYLLITLAVMDRDFALRELTLSGGFGSGNSRTNSIYWAATRSASLSNLTSLNTSKKIIADGQSTTLIESSCLMNSACDAIGMVGECCPTSTGMMLGCCPRLSPTAMPTFAPS